MAEDLYGAYRLRGRYPGDQAWQDLVGPIEHGQFMEEVTRSSPLLGTLLAAGLPLYTVLKMTGLAPGGTGEMKTSRPSLAEIFSGFEGYGRGLK